MNEQNIKPFSFKKGASGNPGGRPKGFGAMIREKTNNGEELINDALTVLRSKKSGEAARANARQFLAAYGFGKPVETVNSNIIVTEYVRKLAPFLDPNKREELARYLTAIEDGWN